MFIQPQVVRYCRWQLFLTFSYTIQAVIYQSYYESQKLETYLTKEPIHSLISRSNICYPFLCTFVLLLIKQMLLKLQLNSLNVKYKRPTSMTYPPL